MKPHSLLCHHNLSTNGYNTFGGIGVAAVYHFTSSSNSSELLASRWQLLIVFFVEL